MHHNIPSDKIVFFGIMSAAIFMVFFIFSRMKNAGFGGKVFLWLLLLVVIAFAAAMAGDCYNYIPNFDPVQWF